MRRARGRSPVYCELLQNSLDAVGVLCHVQIGGATEGSLSIGRRGHTMEAALLVAKDDDSLKALGFILEAWEEGTESGVAPELMAYAALYTALTDLVAAFGEESVADLALGLAKRVNKGEFTLCRTKQ